MKRLKKRVHIAQFNRALHGKSLGLLRFLLPCSVLAVVACMLFTGCGIRQRMWDQPKYEAQEASSLYSNNSSDRSLVSGTVARGRLNLDTHLYEGKKDGKEATDFPIELTRKTLDRGKERYNIYCAICHGPSGNGDGMVVQKGYPQPASYHEERLRNATPGYIYNLIAKGNVYGVMPFYAVQIPVEDRWAIVAYVKALQLSQHYLTDELPKEQGTAEF